MKFFKVFLLVFLFVISSGCAEYKEIKNTRVLKDISYGTKELQKLDVYLPSNFHNKKLPVHIYVHGGAWSMGDKSSAKTHGEFYSDKGIIFVSLNYRLSPENKHPAQTEDVAKGIKWVVDNISKYGGDTKNLYISGHSAGAHIISLVTTDYKYLGAYNLKPTIFKKVIPVDTASFDLTVPAEGGGSRLVNRKINQNFGRSIVKKREASPTQQVKKNTRNPNYQLPEFLIFVSSKRNSAVEQTKTFANVLNLAGSKTELIIVNGKTHGEMNKDISVPNSIVSNAILNVIK